MSRDFVNLSRTQQWRVLNRKRKSSPESRKPGILKTQTETIPIRNILNNDTAGTSADINYKHISIADADKCGSEIQSVDILDGLSESETGNIGTPNSSISSSDSSVCVMENVCVINSAVPNENAPGRLADELRKCFNANNISQKCITNLLDILRRHGHQDLPVDARSLMRTPRCTKNKLVNFVHGQYVHFGLEQGIEDTVLRYNCNDTELSFNINVDGLPISKSSGSQFWPILGDLLIQDKHTEPFVIGVFHGLKKPGNPNEFLKYFVDEYLHLKITGICIQNKMYSIKLNNIICDAPARAYILNIKHHSGYSGCTKCICEGDYIERRVVFLSLNSNSRTDESFRNRSDPDHHRGSTILESLEIDLIKQIPLDYMHLVLLGVTKRILTLWIHGPKNIRLTATQIDDINKLYLETSKFVISDFSRKPRSIHDVERWKATEFRYFLLYAGPVILQNSINNKMYNHILSLIVAIRILCVKNQCKENMDYAKKLLIYFVGKFSIFYGAEYVSYNVHNLIHLADDVFNNGPLDKFSAFKYENLMYKIKQKLKHSSLPLQQLYNRLMEKKLLSNEVSECNSPKIIMRHNNIFGIELKMFSLLLKQNENICLLSDGTIIVVDNITKVDSCVFISGKSYESCLPFFTVPCSSKLLDIYQVSDEFLTICRENININLVSKKVLKLPFENKFVLIPLLH